MPLSMSGVARSGVVVYSNVLCPERFLSAYFSRPLEEGWVGFVRKHEVIRVYLLNGAFPV